MRYYKVAQRKNHGYIYKTEYTHKDNTTAVDYYTLFDNNNNYIDKNINFDNLYKKLWCKK